MFIFYLSFIYFQMISFSCFFITFRYYYYSIPSFLSFKNMAIFQSVGMHWHLWRIRRRQRALFESGLLDTNHPTVPQTNRKLIDLTSLDHFPTRIIGDEPKGLTRSSTRSSIRSLKALENAEYVTDRQLDDEGCVICLDEFSDGEKVRCLPCGHEYHCECIGKATR
jgi:hypothetical protein